MAIKKIVFRGLKRGAFSYTALGGIRIYTGNTMIPFLAPITDTQTLSVLDNAKVSVEGSFSIDFTPFKAFDTSKQQSGIVNSGNYWASPLSYANANLTLEMNAPIKVISKIEFVPLPATDKTDRGIGEPFFIDVFNDTGVLLVSYPIAVGVGRGVVQTLSTPEIDVSNKSFILSSDGYKRYVEGSLEVTSDINAVPEMTSNTSPSGIASASSEFVGWEAWRAFSSTSYWSSATKVSNGYIEYEFEKPIRIGRYSFKTTSTYLDRCPKSWSVSGWNGSSWDVIHTGSLVSKNSNINTFSVAHEQQYKKFRMNILEMFVVTDYLTIERLEFFESIPATLPSLKTVSPTLPSLAQFQEEGMDDLSVFDRKVQQVLGSPQEMTDSVLGEGKVFKGTVDLKKLFDLRKLNVK